MSGILGMVNWSGAPAEEKPLQAMAEAALHRGPDGLSLWRDGKVGLGFLAMHLTPESPLEQQPLVRDGRALVADARIDNRDELIPILRSRGHLRMETPTDADIILGAYRVWGTDCGTRLVGDFAFVVWDPEEQRVFAARDPMAMRPFYYRVEPRRLLFSSEAKQILALHDVPARVFEPALLAHIAGPYGRPEWSFFEGLQQLPPGHALSVRPSGARTWRFWEPDPGSRIRYRREADYGEHFRALFQESVACRLRSRVPIGLMLSGGVDSGSIAAMAGWLLEEGEASPPGFRAYCWAFDELLDGDEREISDVIVNRYGLSRTDIPSDDAWPLSGYPKHGPDRDDPQLWVYQSLIDQTLARAKGEGMGTMLSGDRGDEMVGDGVFDYPGMLLAGRWALLRRELRVLGEPLPRALRRRVLRPLFKRRRESTASRVPRAPWLPPDAVSRCGLDDVILGSKPEPRFENQARQLRYQRIFSFTGARLAVADERRCAAHGLGFADPWSDSRIARFILAIPQWRVQRVSEPKRLAREALVGVVPEAVRKRTSKTIPVGLYNRGFLDRARDTIREILKDPVAEHMGLLDGESVRQEYEAFLAGHKRRHEYWWPISAEMWLQRDWAS